MSASGYDYWFWFSSRLVFGDAGSSRGRDQKIMLSAHFETVKLNGDTYIICKK